MKTGRRSFLKGVGGATAAALAMQGESAEAMAPAPPSAASRQVLELEGQIVGAPRSAQGGGVSAIVSGLLDPGLVVRKDIAGVNYEALSLDVGLGVSSGFFDWVRAFFDRDFQRKNGALIAADFNYREVARREFQDALITEVSFPTFDASSKDPAYMTVKIQPESTHFEPGLGGKVQPPVSKGKNWLVSNFEVELNGMDSATKRVTKVDGFTIKMKTVEQEGEIRPVRSMVYLEVPNIVLTVPMADAQPFLDWFEDFVVKGNSGPEAEKTGAIVCLSPNRKEELLRVELLQVGIVSVGESKQESGADTLRRFQVEFYVEEMKLKIGGIAS